MIQITLPLFLTCLYLVCWLLPSATAADVNFARDVLPVLSNKCFVCHGPDAEEDMLRLDTAELARTERDGVYALAPDGADASGSELLKRIHSTEDPMPPADAEHALTDSERSMLTAWVEQGGKYDRHWAFVIPQRKTPEGIEAKASPSQVVDAFTRRSLESRGVTRAPTADRSTLARRAALTLTGLPPEPDLLQAFLMDAGDRAYEQFVDRLFESERYGEHQARSWLDAVRYGDTHGLHLDNRRGIYPYRDWVIFAFNNNLPLDDFITWQLAGDLLPNPTLEQLVATGYVRMNPSTSEGGVIPDEFQAKNNFDRTETLGTVFLGMTLTCARCHTHKYDPITHDEYYSLFAFFNSTRENPLDGNKYDYAPTIKAPKDMDGWRKLAEWSDKRKALLTESMQAAEGLGAALGDVKNSQDGSIDDRETAFLKLRAPIEKMQKHVAELEQLEQQFTTTLVAAELETPRQTRILSRGEYDLPTGDALEPDVPLALGSFPSDAPRNRLGLAQWLTSRDNPLVARVIANRLWQQVFGSALVRTPEDFGLQGQQPTHPELLDWLAVELHDSNWDMKHFLKLLVLSETFQQSSAWRSDFDDPDNRWLARGPSYRLDAEVLRDTGLWVSGLLDPTMGGEGVKPYQPGGMWEALAHPASNTKSYEADQGQQVYRRSVYVYWKRTSPHPMMTLFDAPSRESSCVRRSRTSTSLQSLGLLNETQRIEMALKFAENLLKQTDNDDARMDAMFSALACRPPDARERRASLDLLETMKARFSADPQAANDLLTTGDATRDTELNATEVAAWTQVAITVLASDLSIMLY